jgi:hypothetical protein
MLADAMKRPSGLHGRARRIARLVGDPAARDRTRDGVLGVDRDGGGGPASRSSSRRTTCVRHSIFLGIGLAAGIAVFQMPMHRWQQIAPWLFAIAALLLVIVLVPGLGTKVNGSRRRWRFGLGLNFQPSELAKLASCSTPPTTRCARRRSWAASARASCRWPP